MMLLTTRVSTLLLIVLLWLGCAAPAAAAVEIHFYSRDLGLNNFPHAFATLKGRVDATGELVDQSFGFTASTISPAILMGSVSGKVVAERAGYIEKSRKQFSVTLTDEQYRSVLQVVESWRTRSQPSYNLNRANCVHFVGELAQAAGLRVTFPKELMKKPEAFLLAIRKANPDAGPSQSQTVAR